MAATWSQVLGPRTHAGPGTDYERESGERGRDFPVQKIGAERMTSKSVTLHEGDYGTFIIQADDGRDVLIQTDWDYPGVASTFGWSPCPCGKTDGTVDCPHRTASDMIVEAGEFLDAHIGDTVEDPGYFED